MEGQRPRSLGTLLVRADAGPGRGSGHVLRQLALAQAWSRRGGEVTLVSVRLPPPLAARWRAAGAEVVDLDSCPVARLLALAGDRPTVWVSLDGYHLGAAQAELREAGKRVLVVDDHAGAAACLADVIVDQNLGARAALYAARPASAELLLGTQYALLRREFEVSAGFRAAVPERPQKVLLTLGSAPPAAVRILLREAVSVALPSAELVELIDESSDERIVEALAGSDMAVAAAGSTAWELCLMQVPTAYVALAENQVPVAKGLSGIGCALDLGEVTDLDRRRVVDALHELSRPATRSRMASRCAGLVDGRGASRVVASLRAMQLSLRPATADDAGLLFAWRNDPVVRRWSFKTDEISWEEHVAWLRDRLAGTSTIYIVSESAGPPIGQVRFDQGAGQMTSEISISLDADARGRGLGAALIRAGVRRYRSEAGDVRIEAMVKPDNRASVDAFDIAGFARSVAVAGGGDALRFLSVPT